MTLLFGILFGIVIGAIGMTGIFLAFVYLSIKRDTFFSQAVRKVEDIARPKARIFLPPTEEEEAQEEIIRKNEERGRDTIAEELGW